MDPPDYADPDIPPGTAINPYAAECFTCPTSIQPSNSDITCAPTQPLCGPLFSGYIDYMYADNYTGDDTIMFDNYASLLNEIQPPTDIQIMGDFADTAFAPNDPM